MNNMKAWENHNGPDPKKKPTPEEQNDGDNKLPLKQQDDAEEDEETVGSGLDESEFDQYDDDGGDDDFRDQLKTTEPVKEEKDKKEKTEMEGNRESLNGVEGTDTHITNAEEEIVNKKGQ